MSRHMKIGLLIAALASLVVAAAAGASLRSKSATTTLVFGASADPVILDGPLVSDGESLRPISQIFQGLVGLKPGTTVIVPQLATSWSTSKNGLTWTFNLRKGVKFQDGTPFNAKAVCFNFNRWYNFPGPLQTDAVTYYWNTVFGGFAHPATGKPGPGQEPLQGLQGRRHESTAVIMLTRKSSSFLGALALSIFGMASPTALVKYKADAGTVDAGRRLPARPGRSGRSIRSAPGRTCSSRGRSATSWCSSRTRRYWGNRRPSWSQSARSTS